MAKSVALNIRIIGNSSRLRRELAKAKTSADKFAAGVRAAGRITKTAMAGLTVLAAQAHQNAVALEKSSQGIKTVFGDNAKAVKNYALKSANNLGISRNKYQEYATVIGAQLKNLKIPHSQVADKTNNLINLGAALAKTFKGDTAQAVEALSAVLRGERDPIEKFGVTIKQSDINARLAAKGLSHLEGDARKLAETEIVLELATEQSKDALKKQAKGILNTQDKVQRLKAKYEDLSATLGEKLLPYSNKFLEWLGKTVEWAEKHPTAVKLIAGGILGIAGAIAALNIAITIYNAKAAIAAVLTKATPWGWAAAIIMLVVGAAIELYRNWDKIKARFEKYRAWFQPVIDAFNTIKDVVLGIIDAINKVIDAFKRLQTYFDNAKKNKKQLAKLEARRVNMIRASMQTLPTINTFNTANLNTAPIVLPGTNPTNTASNTPYTQINITVNGALDPHSTAKQINTILRNYQNRNGHVIIK